MLSGTVGVRREGSLTEHPCPPSPLPPSLPFRRRDVLATIHHSENKRIKNTVSLWKSVYPRGHAHLATHLQAGRATPIWESRAGAYVHLSSEWLIFMQCGTGMLLETFRFLKPQIPHIIFKI